MAASGTARPPACLVPSPGEGPQLLTCLGRPHAPQGSGGTRPLLTLRDLNMRPARAACWRRPGCAVGLHGERRGQDGMLQALDAFPLALPFAELQEVLPPPGPLHQQVRAVHPQVHHLQCPGRHRLPAETLRRAPVSVRVWHGSSPARVPSWRCSGLGAPKGRAGGDGHCPRRRGPGRQGCRCWVCAGVILSWLPPPSAPGAPPEPLPTGPCLPPTCGMVLTENLAPAVTCPSTAVTW